MYAYIYLFIVYYIFKFIYFTIIKYSAKGNVYLMCKRLTPLYYIDSKKDYGRLCQVLRGLFCRVLCKARHEYLHNGLNGCLCII